MLDGLCTFFKEQALNSCLEAVHNSSYQLGLGLSAVSALSFLTYRRLSRSKVQVIESDEDGFEYIPTIDDLILKSGSRKLPIQSLLVAYFATDRDPELHKKYQGAIGKILIPSEGALTFPQIVENMLKNLDLPKDGSYPVELEKTTMSAEQIVAWCFAKTRPAPSL